MSIKRISILSLIIVAIMLAVFFVAGGSFMAPPAEEPAPTSKPPLPSPPNRPAPPAAGNTTGAKIPESTENTTPTHQPPLPAPEDNSGEDDTLTEEQQIALAREKLNSANVEQRIDGAEQLGAYPTPETEALLTQALASDADAEVRNAAAQSLGYVEKPADATIATLLTALEDRDEDVRISALSTLEDFMVESGEGSKRYTRITAGLKAKAVARGTPRDLREAIHDILEDQAENP